jgi:hypothetical protein
MSNEPNINVPKILICILSTYERQGWPTKELADWLANLRCNANYAWQHTFVHNFIPAASARNTIAHNFKDCGADWILMIDNDMSPPANLLDSIKDVPADASVVVPKFYLWDETHKSLKLCWGMDTPDIVQGGKPMIRIEEKYYPLNKCGTGAIFIRPKVFQEIKPPWFWYTYDEMLAMTATEDINFALKVLEHGFKIYGWGGCTVGHHHTVNLAVLASLLYDKTSETPECPSGVSVDRGESHPSSDPTSTTAIPNESR